MSARVTWCCLVLTMVGGPRWSRAQEQNPATIPTDLALALFDRGEYDSGRRSTQFVVGRAPEGMPQSLTSFDGGTVLGGARFAQSSAVVLAFTLPPNQVLLSADRQLRARGWMHPPLPPESNHGGFVSSDNPSPFGNVYCADSAMVMLGAVSAPNGGTYLRLTQARNQQFSPCKRQGRSQFEDLQLTFPVLLPPPGMISHGSGSGRGGGEASISSRLAGLLKPADLIAHYRPQLDAAGWRTRAPVTTGEDAALAYVEATDSTGAIWRGVMLAVQSAPSEATVEIKMFKASGR